MTTNEHSHEEQSINQSAEANEVSRGKLLLASAAATMVAVMGPQAIVDPAEAHPDTATAVDVQSAVQAHETAEKQGSKGTMMFFGDSIIAQYNKNPNSKLQGFWDVAARRLGYKSVANAVGGSGYVRTGKKYPNSIDPGNMRMSSQGDKDYCATDKPGSTVLERLESKSVQRQIKRASKIMLEAGRNDHTVCDENGNLVSVDRSMLKENVDKSFEIVASLVDDPSNVYVFVPWGVNKSTAQGKRITRDIREQAKEYDFNFINTWGVLNNGNTLDGIHPDAKGVQDLADAIINRSDLKKELPKN
jgi:lysophospholipase L1-like esterase